MKKKIFVPTLYPLNRDMQKTWFVKWINASGREQKTYGNLNKLPTKKLRIEEAENIIATLKNPLHKPHKKNFNLPQLLSNLVQYKKAEIEHKSFLSYECIVNNFAMWWRITKNKDAKETDYFNHLAANGNHKNTIRNRFICLKGLCRELVNRGNLHNNPFDGLKFKKVKATSKLPFHPNQVAILKDYMLQNDKQLLLICEFMYYLYLRPNELLQLKIGDILFDENKVVLSGTIAKDDDTIYKTIPLPFKQKIETLKNESCNDFIFGYGNKPGAKHLLYRNVAERHSKMLRKLNISNRYSLYSWVHTGIKNAALSNIPIKQLQLQKGHADLNMFNEYLKDLGVEDCSRLVNEFPAM